jgi:hypothetical protein
VRIPFSTLQHFFSTPSHFNRLKSPMVISKTRVGKNEQHPLRYHFIALLTVFLNRDHSFTDGDYSLELGYVDCCFWPGSRDWLNNLSAIRDIRRFKGFEYAEQYLSLFLDSRASMGILEGLERRCG